MKSRFSHSLRRRRAWPDCARLIPIILALAGCRAEPVLRWPFPAVEAPDDRAVLSTLRERTRPPQNLYAELTMSFQSAEREGVFDAVVRYVRPGRLRMTGFRGLLLSTREVFDLVLDGERCELSLEDQDGGGGERRFSGSVSELGQVHPGFRAFSVLREGLFLPGTLPDGEARVERSPRELKVECRGPGGAEVTWRLDPPTLGIRSAEVLPAGSRAPIALRFTSYREVGGRYFPERFELSDDGAGVRIEGVLREIELDVPVNDLQPEEENGT
jgi:hypothetical protein